MDAEQINDSLSQKAHAHDIRDRRAQRQQAFLDSQDPQRVIDRLTKENADLKSQLSKATVNQDAVIAAKIKEMFATIRITGPDVSSHGNLDWAVK